MGERKLADYRTLKPDASAECGNGVKYLKEQNQLRALAVEWPGIRDTRYL